MFAGSVPSHLQCASRGIQVQEASSQLPLLRESTSSRGVGKWRPTTVPGRSPGAGANAWHRTACPILPHRGTINKPSHHLSPDASWASASARSRSRCRRLHAIAASNCVTGWQATSKHSGAYITWESAPHHAPLPRCTHCCSASCRLFNASGCGQNTAWLSRTGGKAVRRPTLLLLLVLLRTARRAAWGAPDALEAALLLARPCCRTRPGHASDGAIVCGRCTPRESPRSRGMGETIIVWVKRGGGATNPARAVSDRVAKEAIEVKTIGSRGSGWAIDPDSHKNGIIKKWNV